MADITPPKRVMVTLTARQRLTLRPLFDQVKEHNATFTGCVVVAQVWADGLIAKVATGDQLTALQSAFGTDNPTRMHYSAADRWASLDAADRNPAGDKKS